MALQPTDLFAVRRGTTTYKAPFSQVQDYITDQLKATWLPSHLDDPTGVGVSTWNGPADTLTATPDIEVSIAGGAYGTGGAVGSPSQIQIRWIASAVTAAAHAAVLTGRLENAAGNVGVDYTCTIDKLPAAITINAKTDTAASAAVDSDSSSAVAGLNAPARLWLASTDGTLPMVSIAGNTWVAVPTTAANGLAINQGQTFKLRHTTQAGASTVTTTTVRVGWDAASSVTVAFATTNVATKAPVISTVTLADSPEAGRFTSGTFATTVTMTDEGVPASTKGLKAWVEGALKSAPVSSAITAVNAASYTTNGVAQTIGNLVTSTPGALPAAWAFDVASLGTITWATDVTLAPGFTWGQVLFYWGMKTDLANWQSWNRTLSGNSTGTTNFPGSAPGGADTVVILATNDVAGTDGELCMTITKAGVTGVAAGALTTLTLTDATDLAKFAAGDAVTEAGGGDDATGTVGSVDVTAKTITLGTSTGTWDVGSQVKGPLKTITKKPESDVITAVVSNSAGAPTLTVASATNYSTKLSGIAEVAGALSQARYEQLLADANWNSANPDPNKAGAAGAYIYFGAGSEQVTFNYAGATPGYKIYVLTDSGTGPRSYTYTVSGDVVGATPSGSVGYGDPNKDSHEIELTQASGTLTFTSGRDLMIRYIGVDTGTTLTFSTDKDLATFQAGLPTYTAVHQDSGYTANSDTITAVGSTTGSFTFTGAQASYGFTKPVDTTSSEFGFDGNPGGNYNYSPSATGQTLTASALTPFAFAGDTVLTFQYGSTSDDLTQKKHQLVLDDASVIDASSSTVSATGSALYFTFTIPAGRTCKEVRCVNGTAPATRAIIFGIMVNGVSLLTDFSIATLTLATDKDLANFASGDAVQQDSVVTSSPVLYTSSTGHLLTGTLGTDGFYYSGMLDTAASTWSTAWDDFWEVKQAGTLVLSLNSSAGNTLNLTVTGDATSGNGSYTSTGSSNQVTVTLVFSGPGTAKISYTSDHSYQAGGVAYYFGYASRFGSFDGTPITDVGLNLPKGTVGSVDATAKTITLSSSTGTWSANTGNHIVGPAKTAGSGTIASVDVAAKTMTLSTSTGTWVANAAKYAIGEAQPSASVRLYTVHDAAGAVSDLQSADPGYVTMTGNSPYTLTFPATFPTGNAPDVDLPAGTTITTDVQATSTGSTPVNKASNTVTPA